MRKFTVVFAVLTLLALAVVPGFAQDEEPTIVDIVLSSTEAESPEFTVLLEAVLAADPAIAETLSSPDSLWTVFAPTDAAFVALLGELEIEAADLLADTELLTEVLLYHVVPGAFYAEDVAELDGVYLGTALPGTALLVSAGEDGVFVDESTVISTDIEASNGVVHVIDSVLLPPMGDDMEEMDEEGMDDDMAMDEVSIAETVIAAAEGDEPQFTVLLAAVLAADPAVAEILTNNGPFTVFAPTDEAFGALLEALGVTADELLADTDLLTTVLSYHVVPGTFAAADVVELAGMMEDGISVATLLGGESVTISLDGESVFVNESQVISTDIYATNGVVHVIDAVLLPPSDEESM